MRAPIAFAVCVSAGTTLFSGILFGQVPPPVKQTTDRVLSDGSPSQWAAVYKAGLAASDRHSDEEALRLFKQSWETAVSAAGRGVSASGIGQTYRRIGRLQDAIFWLERARQAFGESPDPDFRLAVTASDLADLYRITGNYGAAERVLREELDSKSLVSATHDAESRGLLRNNLAALLREEGRSAEAEPLLVESIELHAVSSRQRAGALIGLADIDRQKGAWEASINRWNEALEICRREQDMHAEAIVLRGLGATWLNSGAAARAEPLLRRSLRIMETSPDMPLEEVASAHSGLAELYRAENKLALAEDEWSRALEIDRPILGENHPQVALLMEMLSEVFSARGQFDVAREYATKASEAMSGSFGDESMPVATALTNKAVVEERASNLDAAAQDYERAIRIANLHPEHRSLRAVMIQRYARLLKSMHRSREAKALLLQRDSAAVLPR